MTTINKAFNPHKIYFVGSDGTCEPSYDITTILDNDIDTFSNLTDGKSLDIFDKGDLISPDGQAYGIPNNFLKIEGDDNENASTSQRLVHEVGHCLGLSHTFTGSAAGDPLNEDECVETDENCPFTGLPSCICCGDYVCDTPPAHQDPTFILDETCEFLIEPPNSDWPPILYKNIMSYADPIHCRTLLSEGQVKRMWAYLALSDLLQEVQVKNIYSGTLQSGTYGDIIVASGTELEITSDIEMFPGAKIIVEKNAALRVRGSATISAACDEKWQGIIVKGTANLEQKPENQGVVTVNGVIKDARVGVDVQETDGAGNPIVNTGGGIAYIHGAEFLNNDISVRFGQYSGANRSKIIFNEFKIDNENLEGNIPIFLDLNGITTIQTSSNTFKDERSECVGYTSRATGIRAFNAGFRATASTFENLNKGTDISIMSAGSGTFFISNNRFNACRIGVDAIRCNDFYLANNQFNVKRPIPCNNNGGKLEIFGAKISGNASAFKFLDNSFFYEPADENEEYPNDILIGTQAANLGAGMANIIEKNDYTELIYGNQAFGNNADKTEGLVYLCNTNNNHSADLLSIDFFIPKGRIRRMQADIVGVGEIEATGNSFEGLGNTIINNGNVIEYHYYMGDETQNPNTEQGFEGNININPLTEPNERCGEEDCPPPCRKNYIQTKETRYFVNQEIYIELQELLTTLPVDSEQYAILTEEISRIRLFLNQDLSYILRHYQHLEDGLVIDSLNYWLDLAHTYPSDLRLLNYYFFNNQALEMDNIWERLHDTYSLLPYQIDELERLEQLYDTLYPYVDGAGDLLPLNPSTLYSLEAYLNECDEAGYLAMVILRQYGIATELECSDLAFRQPTSSSHLLTDVPLKIFPNPTDSELTIQLNEEKTFKAITIYNTQGQQVFHIPFTHKSNQHALELPHLTNGIYILEVLTDKERFKEKISIQH